MKELTSKKVLVSIIIVVSFSAGIIANKLFSKPVIIKNTVLREGGYKYINPLLLCNINNNNPYNENVGLTDALNAYSANHKDNEMSVYFLNLATGEWSSLNEEKTYSPASMMKVPTTMETLKYSELHPDILTQPVYYDGSFDNNKNEYFKPEKSIAANRSYTVDELLTYIVDYSDNNALNLLHNTLKPQSFEKLYQDLHIEIPTNLLDFMTVRTYTSFLRVLYNSTYLSRDNSEKMVEMMSYSDFPNGLRAGVPSNIEVSQKFGERQVLTPEGKLTERELHDCGIVYPPNNQPYSICIMTRGKDFDSMAGNIKDISKITYDYINK